MANYHTIGNYSQHDVYVKYYKSARTNLLVLIAFTVINILLLISGANFYFLFSAYIPYVLAITGMFICGYLPDEYYEGDMFIAISSDNSPLFICLAISIVVLAIYLVAWIFSSKNRVGWLIFALVFIIIDTIAMIVLVESIFSVLIDMFFHTWLIVSLIIGIIAHFKLKKLPPKQEEVFPLNLNNQTAEGAIVPDSNVLRMADMGVKYKVLLEKRVLDYEICYRRVKGTHTNELVVNGNVYDEYKARMEFSHTLIARIDGHYITAGFDGIAHSFICFDGQEILRKIRLV